MSFKLTPALHPYALEVFQVCCLQHLQEVDPDWPEFPSGLGRDYTEEVTVQSEDKTHADQVVVVILNLA